MDLQKILKIVAILIGLISIFFLGSILSSGDEAIKAGESSGTVNVFMYVSYAILAIAVLIVLAFTVLNLVSNTSGFKNTLNGIGAFVVLSLLCYFGFANRNFSQMLLLGLNVASTQTLQNTHLKERPS